MRRLKVRVVSGSCRKACRGLVRELTIPHQTVESPMSFARQFVFLFGLGFAMNIGLAPAHAAQDEDFFLDEDPDEEEDDVEIERIDEEDDSISTATTPSSMRWRGTSRSTWMMPYDDEEEDEEAELLPVRTTLRSTGPPSTRWWACRLTKRAWPGRRTSRPTPTRCSVSRLPSGWTSLVRRCSKDLKRISRGRGGQGQARAGLLSRHVPRAHRSPQPLSGGVRVGLPVLDQPDRQPRAADRPRLLRPRWNGSSIHRLEPRGWRALRAH